MRDIASTRREAALALSPEDVATGITLLDALIAKASRKAKQLNGYFALGLFVTTLLLPVGLGFGFAGLVTEGTGGFLTAISMACIVLWATGTAGLWWSWTAIQTNSSMGRFGKIPDLELPLPLQDLIGLYASGARELRTDAGSVVPATMFASQWAILLFSEDRAERQLVRSPKGVKEVRPVLVLPDVAASSSATEKDDSDGEREAYSGYRAVRDGEPPLRNHNPEMAWLVAGTLKQFKAGLDELLEDVSPRLTEAYRIIFTEGRSHLRKDGTRGAQTGAIKAIVSELVRSGENRPGTSEATIKKLLAGRKGTKDIRGYFSSRYG